MKIKYSKIIPFKGFFGINLFGTLFIRDEYRNRKVGQITINHEEIHTAQMKELLYIPFYILYFFEWLFWLVFGNGYYDISFEKEAYENQDNMEYLKNRKHYAMWRKKIKKELNKEDDAT